MAIFTYEETGSLRPEEKDAILDAMLGMAWSDGTVQVEEVDLLKRLAANFTDKDILELIRDYKPDTERVGRKIASSDLGPAGKRILLRAMAYVAAAEGTLDEKEAAFYRACLRSFGVPEPVRERMEGEVHREVYRELFRKKALGGDLGESGRAELAALQKRLKLDDPTVAELEQVILKQCGKSAKEPTQKPEKAAATS